MFANLQSSSKTGLLALAIALASGPALAADEVRASFDRMLAHEPTSASAPAALGQPADPLVAALVVPLRDGVQPARAFVPADPVFDSFARMFSHQPNRASPALPAGTGPDPLIAVVVRPLLRDHLYGVRPVGPLARR